MSDWKANKQWSDIFIPEIKSILGQTLIGEASVEDDQLRNTDLIVLSLKALRIGCRIRKHNYYLKYPNDFTIRYSLPSRTPTEFDKIMAGWGDYLFYGFSDVKEKNLILWRLIKLERFRAYVAWFARENGGKHPGCSKPNGDGSSTFRAFNIRDRYVESLIAHSGRNE